MEERRGIFRIILSWSGEDGKRKRKSIATGLAVKGNKRRAEELLREAKKKQEEILLRQPGIDGLLFADFMEEWLEVIRPDVKLTTFGGYQLNVQRAIGPYFREKGTLLCELTADDINEVYAERLKTVKATSVHKCRHANISKALKYAVQKDYIPHSVMGKVKRPKPARYVGKFLKQSETVELFEAVKGHKLELAVIFGAFYGLRRSEVVGLRWESIDFEANKIKIEHTVSEAVVDGKRFTLAEDTTKTKSSFRTLPLVPAIRTKLLEVKAEQEQNRKLCGKAYNTSESCYIYTDALGNRIRLNYLTTEFPKFMEKNGFRRMRFHDTRHSCASLLLANGVSLKQIQEWVARTQRFCDNGEHLPHLDYNSKLASASAMAWIDDTSLGYADSQEITNVISENRIKETLSQGIEAAIV